MEYTYTDITQNPNIYKIHLDVEDSAMTDKTIEECNWDDVSNELKVVFTNSLIAGDKTILDTIVSSNESIPELLSYKITGNTSCVLGLNINLFGLFRKDVFDLRGSLISKEYYKNYNGTTYSDLVVKDEYVYTINPANDLVTYRDETITWYVSDDTIGCTKEIKKYYGLITAIKEGVARRTNLLDQAKAYGLAYITGTHASGIPNSYYWFSTMHTEVQDYLDGTKKQDIIDFIDNETDTYVTQTIKDTMTDILDYWTE